DPHASGRHQGNFHYAVVDDQQIHPLLPSAVQSLLLDGERDGALDPQLVAGDLPVPYIQPLLGVGQQELGGLTRARAQGEQHGTGLLIPSLSLVSFQSPTSSPCWESVNRNSAA